MVKECRFKQLLGNMEDLDMFAPKKIIHNREWGKNVLNKRVKYQEEKTPDRARLGKLDKEAEKTHLPKKFR